MNAVATRGPHGVDVLVWNYHDEDVAAPPAEVHLRVKGLAGTAVQVQQFRMDGEHSNSYTAWQRMGSPQRLSHTQQMRLQKSGMLQGSAPRRVVVQGGAPTLELSLPRQGVWLVRMNF